MELSATEVDEKGWFALRNRLTDALIEALGIPDSERWHVNVKLNRYDPHSFAVAGNATDELDHLTSDDAPRKRGGARWIRPTVLLGFAVGAFAGYRWIAGRIGDDAVVDTAPPLDAPTGSPNRAGGADAATEAVPTEY